MTVKSKRLSEVVEGRNAELALRYQNVAAGIENEAENIPTGIQELDDRGLLEKGILTGFAAHPGDGKSAVAASLLKSAALAGYSPVGMFFEDPSHLLADRWTAQELNESAFHLRRLKLDASKAPRRLSAATENINDWAQHVTLIEEIVPSQELIDWIYDVTTEETGLVVVDYAQAFDSEPDERSVERVIARLAWGLNQAAKHKKIATVLFNQCKREVQERGHKRLADYRFKVGEPTETSLDAVEGYRPLGPNDAQWSTAIGQRCKQWVDIFRPGNWLKTHGINAKDDRIDFTIQKGNYGPPKGIISCHFDGPTARISSRKRGH